MKSNICGIEWNNRAVFFLILAFALHRNKIALVMPSKYSTGAATFTNFSYLSCSLESCPQTKHLQVAERTETNNNNNDQYEILATKFNSSNAFSIASALHNSLGVFFSASSFFPFWFVARSQLLLNTRTHTFTCQRMYNGSERETKLQTMC